MTMRMARRSLGAAAAVLALALLPVSPGFAAERAAAASSRESAEPSAPVQLSWRHIFGSRASDTAHAIAADGDGVYVAGFTAGSFGGQTNRHQPSLSAYLVRFDTTGRRSWTRIFGGHDSTADSLAVDGNGGVWASGATAGSFGGQINHRHNGYSGFLVHYDQVGTLTWTHIFDDPNEAECTGTIASDGTGGVYVAGSSDRSFDGQTNPGAYSACLAHYNAGGDRTWTRIFGSSDYDRASSIAADGTGGVYVAGETAGSFGGQTNPAHLSAFLVHYDALGQRTLTRIFGSDVVPTISAVASDTAGNVYLTGSVVGPLGGQGNPGGPSPFLVRLNAAGQRQWTRVFGGPSGEYPSSVVAEGNAVFVTGMSEGTFEGQANPGKGTAFLARYDTTGGHRWSRLIGSEERDQANGIASDGAGGVYVVGATEGSFAGRTNPGGYSPFVVHFGVP
jgi:hypothetical protein